MKKFLILMCAILALSFTEGCSSTKLATGGAYNGDTFLYQSDQTIDAAQKILTVFVKWEYDNRAILRQWPEIKTSADYVRANAEKWINTCLNLRTAYIANGDKQALETGLSVLQQAVVEATTYMKQRTITK